MVSDEYAAPRRETAPLAAFREAHRRADHVKLWLDFIALLVLLSALFMAWLWAEGWLS